MNKQRVFLWAGSGLLLFLLLSQTPLVSTLFALFVLGIIPGTNYIVPAWVILLAYPSLMLASIFWIHRQSFFIGETSQPAKPIVAKQPKSSKPVRSKRARTAKKRVSATV